MSDIMLPYAPFDENVCCRFASIIKVIVGANNHEYGIHRDVLTTSSEVLIKALASPKINKLEFPAIDHSDFNVYINWLYTGILRAKAAFGDDYRFLAELYFLGVQLNDKKFRDTIISAVLHEARSSRPPGTKKLPNANCLNIAYEGYRETPASKAVRLQKVLVEIYAREEDPKHYEVICGTHGVVPTKFFEDYGRRVKELVQAKVKTMAQVGTCEFHEHEAKEQCGRQEPARKRLKGE